MKKQVTVNLSIPQPFEQVFDEFLDLVGKDPDYQRALEKTVAKNKKMADLKFQTAIKIRFAIAKMHRELKLKNLRGDNEETKTSQK